MAGSKFYWLKLDRNFFQQKEIKKLRRIASGDTYVILYMKMLLLTLDSEGKLYFDGVENDLAGEITLQLDEPEGQCPGSHGLSDAARDAGAANGTGI